MNPQSEEGARTVIGIAECRASDNTEAELATYALGSCIAVTAWDPERKIGGLLHFMLPDSSLDVRRGRTNPAVYADTGVPLLIEECLRLGADRRRLIVRAAGGARVLASDDVFNIGERNHLGMRKAFWKCGLLLDAEAVGGTLSRSVRLSVGTGRMLVREGSSEWSEIRPKSIRARSK